MVITTLLLHVAWGGREADWAVDLFVLRLRIWNGMARIGHCGLFEIDVVVYGEFGANKQAAQTERRGRLTRRLPVFYGFVSK